jgi:hypothetical protein
MLSPDEQLPEDYIENNPSGGFPPIRICQKNNTKVMNIDLSKRELGVSINNIIKIKDKTPFFNI